VIAAIRCGASTTRRRGARCIGHLLVLAGLLVPTRSAGRARLMRLAHAISKVTTPIVMGIMYLVVMTPFASAPAVRGNPLEHTLRAGLLARAAAERRRSNLSRQF